MKRHPLLQPLSREHHAALQLALNARRAASARERSGVEAMSLACVEAFAGELDPHFIVEETTLLPLLVAAGEDALAQRLESEHRQLRELAGRLLPAAAPVLLAFAELLSAHVRFEERELFVVVQALLEARPLA